VDRDRIERDLELAIIEGAIIAGDHEVDFGGVVGDPDSGVGKGVDYRRLADREHGRPGVEAQQPRSHRIDGVQHLVVSCGNSETGELGDIGVGVLRGIVGEEEDSPVKLAQRCDQLGCARQEIVAKIDRAIEIEDVPGEQ
jgi:hypothetical protein